MPSSKEALEFRAGTSLRNPLTDLLWHYIEGGYDHFVICLTDGSSVWFYKDVSKIMWQDEESVVFSGVTTHIHGTQKIDADIAVNSRSVVLVLPYQK